MSEAYLILATAISYGLVVLMSMFNAIVDSELILSNKHINHTKNSVFRGAFFSLQTWSLYFTHGWININFFKAAEHFVIQCAIFWITFDLLLNYYRGLDLGYIGKTSYLDKLFGKFVPDLYWFTFLKIVIVFVLLAIIRVAQWIFS